MKLMLLQLLLLCYQSFARHAIQDLLLLRSGFADCVSQLFNVPAGPSRLARCLRWYFSKAYYPNSNYPNPPQMIHGSWIDVLTITCFIVSLLHVVTCPTLVRV